MFPKAHRILLVIICNGWFPKDIIQTSVTDYADHRNKDGITDYTNGINDNNQELRDLHTNVDGSQPFGSSLFHGRRLNQSKPPRTNQKTNFAGFRNQQVSTMTINPAQQISEISSQGRERPFFPPRAVESMLDLLYIKSIFQFYIKI